jgi:hypothetical protein
MAEGGVREDTRDTKSVEQRFYSRMESLARS